MFEFYENFRISSEFMYCLGANKSANEKINYYFQFNCYAKYVRSGYRECKKNYRRSFF